MGCSVHVEQIIPHVVVLLDVLCEALSNALLHVVRIEPVLRVEMERRIAADVARQQDRSVVAVRIAPA